MTEKKYIAVDLGAESGRVILGTITDNKLTLEEVYRFINGPTEMGSSIKWDFEKLFSDIKQGITKAIKATNGKVESIAVDSWGVDYGLIDKDGKLIDMPYHYRDSRTDDMMQKAFDTMGKKNLYNNTGIQFMQFNTVYQLLADTVSNKETLVKTDKMIMMADLVAYYLCGQPFVEYTLASTGQFLDMRTGSISDEVFEKLSLPKNIIPKLVQPGSIVGQLKGKLAKEFSCSNIPIAAVGSHDTASAVAAVPASSGENWAYLSSGTWSLLGIETPNAIINDDTFSYQFTNEGGVENTIRLLKNIMGLWLVQECRRQWQRQGQELDYSQIAQMASDAKPFVATINPNNSDFLAPGDMPARINKTLANPIENKGQMIRVILESLAFNYRWVIEKLEQMSGKTIDVLHIVGGGIQNELLCQFAANATGKKVITGPIEATASGNLLMQAKACGQISSLDQARQIVQNSFGLKEYQPQNTEDWNKQYENFLKIFNA